MIKRKISSAAMHAMHLTTDRHSIAQGEQAQLMSCAICKIGKYCDATCQRQDWPVHKLVCKELKEMRKATTAS